MYFVMSFSSLSMYYFECCHKLDRQTDDDKKERLIFSTPHGHKHVGTRGFEFDSAYTHFLELFFSVSENNEVCYLILYNPYIDTDITNNFAHMRTRECVMLWKCLK